MRLYISPPSVKQAHSQSEWKYEPYHRVTEDSQV